MARSEIRQKRLFLDNIERALEVAADNNYEDMERRTFYSKALEEAADSDALRSEKRLEDIVKDGERLTEIGLLSEIRKQIAEISLFLKKTDYQNKRRLEWELYGPPSRVKNEYDEFIKRHSSIDSDTIKPLEASHETDDINSRAVKGIEDGHGHRKINNVT